jgi:hypothetical protein
VAITVVADSSVTDEQLAQVRTLTLQVDGSEPFAKTFEINNNELGKRQVQVVYRPTLAEAADVNFTAVCTSGGEETIANGTAQARIEPGKTTEVTVTLSASAAGDGGGDGLSPDLKPPPKKLGESCSTGEDCQTGFCADGLCCNTACGDACQACNIAGQEGHCTSIANGNKPVHGNCPALAANDIAKPCSTDGFCDGQGACRLHAMNTQCSAQVCDTTTDVFTPPAVCDGAGRCIVVPSFNCAPFRCENATKCWETCTVPNQATQCSGANSCVSSSCGKLPKGRTCTSGTQCLSGNCIDGVCCTQAVCAGQCEACDADPADKGECKPVTGAPHGVGTARAACTGDGSGGCGGSCNGTLRTACTYPTGACRTQSCSTATGSPVLTLAANCNGAGSCPAVTSPCSPPSNMLAACDAGGTSCAFSCQNNYADCNGGLGNGCETNIGSDASNCGSCGNACASSLQGSVCSNKSCVCTGGQVACATPGVSPPNKCYSPSVTQCCAPNGANGCGCTRGTCNQFQCSPPPFGFCYCVEWNYSCSGGGGGCQYQFVDGRYTIPGGGHCYGGVCFANGNSGFKCDI